ncbi:3'-5' exonuclease [Aliivibrio salmonicida]|uniref:3'-5' exonuclease n=1 Tax=Aliivibrio salmonicida TaxID=40269 RepID=UPI00406D134F
MISNTHQEILNWPAFFTHKFENSKDKRLRKFYQTGIYEEETPLKDIEFVALDFETTGLDANQNSIISIGLVPFTLQRIRCRESQHWFVKAQDNLEENSVVIHGITHSDLQGAPDLRRILEKVLDALAGKVVVVHYRKIERDFFDINLRNLIGEGIVFPVVDTMQIEGDYQQEQSKGIINWLKGKRPESIRLANCRLRYGLPAYAPHHALTDAIATAELFQAQISYHFSENDPIRKIWQ